MVASPPLHHQACFRVPPTPLRCQLAKGRHLRQKVPKMCTLNRPLQRHTRARWATPGPRTPDAQCRAPTVPPRPRLMAAARRCPQRIPDNGLHHPHRPSPPTSCGSTPTPTLSLPSPPSVTSSGRPPSRALEAPMPPSPWAVRHYSWSAWSTRPPPPPPPPTPTPPPPPNRPFTPLPHAL